MTTRYSFYNLAVDALQEADVPLTQREIWDLAVNLGLDQKLPKARGERWTPWDTLGARLYVRIKQEPTGLVGRIGVNPAKFWLRARQLPRDDQGT